jgi:hypothetical protein
MPKRFFVAPVIPVHIWVLAFETTTIPSASTARGDDGELSHHRSLRKGDAT